VIIIRPGLFNNRIEGRSCLTHRGTELTPRDWSVTNTVLATIDDSQTAQGVMFEEFSSLLPPGEDEAEGGYEALKGLSEQAPPWREGTMT
jgi:hypothetical protein